MFTVKARFSAAIAFSIALSVFSNFAQTPQPEYRRVRTFDARHYVIRVKFDRASKTVFGDTTVRLTPLENNFKTVELDAANLKFESVVLENENRKLDYKTDGEKIFINLGKKYSTNDVISVRLKYSTVKPKKGVYFVNARTENGKVVRDAQIWTQGEAEEAHFWFPSYDFPDDKATSEKFITIEPDETAIGNGELIETRENGDGTKTVHYAMREAHSTYLTSFVVGKYTKYADSYKNIPLGFYLYARGNAALGFTVLPDGKSTVPTAFARTKEMIRVYEELTGVDFPYKKYDQTIVADFAFGGMENVTATTLSDTEIFYAPPGNVTDLVSHELAHSWFGNLVTCSGWAELWLNEGLATFMEAAYREKIFGRQDYQRAIRESALQFMVADAVTHANRGLFYAAARPNDDLFSPNNAAITYKKGGAVIHALRETVGTENFWKAINLYLNRHKFQTVGSRDLQKAMEEVSNTNLEWFFSQWVYGAGYPKLNIRQKYDEQTKILNLIVSQTQKAAKTATAFRLPVNVRIETASGITIEKLEINKREQIFNFKINDEPKRIIFDPEEKIPLKTVKYL